MIFRYEAWFESPVSDYYDIAVETANGISQHNGMNNAAWNKSDASYLVRKMELHRCDDK